MQLLEANCNRGTTIFDTPLNPRTALMAQDCEAVNIFVNDDCGKETLEVLKKMGVQLVTLRCEGLFINLLVLNCCASYRYITESECGICSCTW